MAAYLPPVEKPRGLLIKVVYLFARRMFGKVPTGSGCSRRACQQNSCSSTTGPTDWTRSCGWREQVVCEMAVQPIISAEELAKALRDAPPPTPDDVTMLPGGRRIDSRASALAWLAELEAERATAPRDV